MPRVWRSRPDSIEQGHALAEVSDCREPRRTEAARCFEVPDDEVGVHASHEDDGGKGILREEVPLERPTALIGVGALGVAAGVTDVPDDSAGRQRLLQLPEANLVQADLVRSP